MRGKALSALPTGGCKSWRLRGSPRIVTLDRPPGSPRAAAGGTRPAPRQSQVTTLASVCETRLHPATRPLPPRAMPSWLHPGPITAATAALVLALALTGPAPAQAQGAAQDRGAVLAVVRRLFDGMRAGDSAAVRATFHPEAMLATARVRNGAAVFEVDTVDAFVRAVGTPHPVVWDERIRKTRVELDGPLASVWAEYSFYAGPTFSHCGIDAFQLARDGEAWRIVALTDTRRRDGCPDPPAR